ncbi:MAG TPA: FecR family protein [Polyangiales bacterium]|nr:FecR family protein [Polyangiales bacterium]
MTRPARLADHVRLRANEARIERQWSALEQAGLPGPRPAGRSRWRAALALASAGALAASAAFVWVERTREPSLPVGALVESADSKVAVQLEDGSRVELSPRAQLRLLKNAKREVRLELRGGKARFAVAHDRSRPFKVEAGSVEIRVVGTRFELGRSRESGGERLEVAVSEGVVEVRRAGEREVHTLRAGERWSALVSPPAVLESKPVEPAPAAPAESELDAVDSALDPAAELQEPEAEADGERERSPGQRGVAARERAAARVFERANLARRAGRMRDAADAYAELLARYPRDRRAGLSAFELGRIRMDALSDPRGAIEALERAAAAGDAASFHEDALARMVVANDAEGRREACRKARERYLERYPSGVHAHVLAGRCR